VAGGKRASPTRLFLKHLANGGSKSIPAVGGILEEICFVVHDSKQADEEMRKLRIAIEALPRDLAGADVEIVAYLQRLLDRGDLSSSLKSRISALRAVLSDTEHAPLPDDIENAVRRVISNLELRDGLESEDATPDNSFWHDRGRYGSYHWADRDSQRYCREALVVFVHGLFGGAESTWGALPSMVLQRAEIDVDVFSFAYPTMPWQRASIFSAAEDLRSVLLSQFRVDEPSEDGVLDTGYRHIVFITHSTGGLVVKAAMSRDYQEIRKSEVRTFSDLSLNALRARHIVNVAVPHLGGRAQLTYPFSVIYHGLFVLAAPFLYLTSLLTQRNLDLGYNRLARELPYRNSAVIRLSKSFQDGIAWAKNQGLPVPRITEIRARADVAVAEELLGVADHEAAFRGTHHGVKLPQAEHELVVEEIYKYARRFRDTPAWVIAQRSVSRTWDLDRQSRVGELYGSVRQSGHRRGLRRQVTPVSQAASLQSLVEALDQVGEGEVLVLTGGPGVGKSTVLRRLTSVLAKDFLFDADGKAPLPITMPLQQFTVGGVVPSSDKGDVSDGILTLILSTWTDWVCKRLTYENAVTSDWVAERLRTRPTVLVLDSIDEFLASNPAIRFDDIRSMLTHILRRVRTTNRVTIVLGVRNTLPDYHRLADNTRVFELGLLDEADAVRLNPEIAELLQEITDESLRDVLLTPLILSRLSRQGAHARSRFRSRADLVHATLLSIMEESDLTDPSPEAWLEALVPLAWAYFSSRQNELELAGLLRVTQQFRSDWSAAAKSGDTVLPGSLDAAFGLAVDRAAALKLLQRSVFFPTGPETYRFQHKEWSEHLASRYLANCIENHFYEGFGDLGCTNAMFRTAGEILGDIELTRDDVVATLVTAKKTGKSFIAGNFCGVLANSNVRLSGSAITALIDGMERMSPIGRIVFFNGINRRILAGRAEDDTAASLRQSMIPVLQAEASRRSLKSTSVTASIAWCYLAAFAKKYGTPAPDSLWYPDLGAAPEHEEDALPLVCATAQQPYAADKAHESIQAAFLEIVPLTLIDDSSPISVIHYLYYLAVACKYGVQITTVARELPRYLAPDSEVRIRLEAYDLVPELSAILGRIRALIPLPHGTADASAGDIDSQPIWPTERGRHDAP